MRDKAARCDLWECALRPTRTRPTRKSNGQKTETRTHEFKDSEKNRTLETALRSSLETRDKSGQAGCGPARPRSHATRMRDSSLALRMTAHQQNGMTTPRATDRENRTLETEGAAPRKSEKQIPRCARDIDYSNERGIYSNEGRKRENIYAFIRTCPVVQRQRAVAFVNYRGCLRGRQRCVHNSARFLKYAPNLK